MISELVAALRALDPEITAEEVADILWLGARMPAPRGGVSPAAARGQRPVDRAGPAPPRPPDRPESPQAGDPAAGTPPPATRAAQPGSATPASVAAETIDMHLPPPRLFSDQLGIQARSPAVPALPATLDLSRALRQLNRQLPSRTGAEEVDERETVRLAAEEDVWLPVMRRTPGRWLDLALVIDDAPSMAIWQRTVAELRELLQRAGMFGDIRIWHCNSDATQDGGTGGTGGIGLRGEDAVGVGRRDHRELVDPSGRRLVLVVSDCVGWGWADGSMAEALACWGRSGPVAVVQPLPQRLWDDCLPRFARVQIRAGLPGVPNDRLAVRPRPGEAALTGAGVAIPVLELDARWLAPWASLVAGTGGGWVNSTVLFTGSPAGPAAAPGADAQPAADADELVARFRSRASVDADRLAVYLAGAPLSLPVMRLVQSVMMPDSRTSHLAEVFLSQMLERVSPADHDFDPDEVEYDFKPGVRARLLSRLPKPEALRVLSQVSAFVSQRLGAPLDFRVLLTSGSSAEDLSEMSPPFAAVAVQVLKGMGGRYAIAAERLSRLSAIAFSQRRSRHVVPKLAWSPRLRPSDDTLTSRDLGDDVTTPDRQPIAVRERGSGGVNQPAIWGGVPLRNPHFTGRIQLLEELRRTLVVGSDTSALLLHAVRGLGGVGKTQLAVEYVYQYATEYDLVWWVPAEDPALVRTSLAALSAALGLPESADVGQSVRRVLDALRTGQPHARWLLVFDNADQPEDLRPYLPYPSGHVLITSRNQSWGELATTVEVDVFDRAESIALLRRRGDGIAEPEADRLAARLGDLPLALEQAAAWQAETGMTVDEYVRLLDVRLDLLREKPPASYPKPVAAAWGLAFEQLREQAPGAVQLLEVCAYFGAEPISLDLLWAGRRADLPSPLDRVLRDEIGLRRAVRDIGRYALARLDTARNSIQVHRLVQAVLREGQTPEQQASTRRTAQLILAEASPGRPDNQRNWRRHADLSPHLVPSGAVDSDDLEVRRVVLDQIRFRYAMADFESSREFGELVVETWLEKWGPDEELTLLAQRHLANTLRALGETGRAAEIDEDILARVRAVFGDEHEHALVTANSFGADLRGRGDFLGARALDEENLGRARRVLGDDDPTTLRIANNLGVDLRLLGEFTTAQSLEEDTLARKRRGLGDDHRDVLYSVRNVVHGLYGAGHYEEALRRQEEVMPLFRQSLGPDHDQVLLAERNIGITLRKLGEYGRARVVLEEHVNACLRRFGPDHEHTLAAMMSLCNARRAMNELNEARLLGEQALSRYRATFGEQHPFTLAAATNVAIVLRHLGEHQVARAMNEAARDALRQFRGDDHPYTLCCASNLGNDLAAGHDHPAARDVSQDVYDRSRLVRGADHPYTLAAAANLAIDLSAVGEADQAAALHGAALRGLAARLGEDHPETIAAAARRRTDADIEPPPL